MRAGGRSAGPLKTRTRLQLRCRDLQNRLNSGSGAADRHTTRPASPDPGRLRTHAGTRPGPPPPTRASSDTCRHATGSPRLPPVRFASASQENLEHRRATEGRLCGRKRLHRGVLSCRSPLGHLHFSGRWSPRSVSIGARESTSPQTLILQRAVCCSIRRFSAHTLDATWT